MRYRIDEQYKLGKLLKLVKLPLIRQNAGRNAVMNGRATQIDY